MRTNGRVAEIVLYAVVAALALGWIAGSITSFGGVPDDPGPAPGYYQQLLVLWTVVAGVWLVAARLLWRAWWARTGAGLAALDPPARVLAVAVGTLPAGRRDWGTAMIAELAEVQPQAARWRFALGCARTAAFPPGSSRERVTATGALAVGTVIVAGLAVDRALPELVVFTVTFLGLVGALAVLAVARSRRLRAPGAAPTITAAGLAGVVGGIAATGYFLAEYPIAARHLRPAEAVFLAVLLTGYLWLTLAPPPELTSDRLARHLAVGVALALGTGLWLRSRLGLSGTAGWDSGIGDYLYLVPVPVIFVAAALVAAGRRSFRAGLQTAIWTALLTSTAIFAVAVLEAVRWYQLDSSLIFGADTIPLDAVGENLRDFTWGLILFPFWWLPFGVIGAALGGLRGRRRRAGDTAGRTASAQR